MPYAIADSDDEGDDVDNDVGEQDDCGFIASRLGTNGKNGEGAIESYDGTNEKSTGSTGTLKISDTDQTIQLIVRRTSKKRSVERREKANDDLRAYADDRSPAIFCITISACTET